MTHSEKAAELFLQGYNCAQAVAVAFCDVTGLNEKLTAKTISAFGGGMEFFMNSIKRAEREVCGAVSGMFMVLSYLYGYDDPNASAEKKQLYTRVQDLAGKFREINGSIICRELLNNPPSDPDPSPRTAQYYAQRPCVRMVMTAADLMDEFIENNPV